MELISNTGLISNNGTAFKYLWVKTQDIMTRSSSNSASDRLRDKEEQLDASFDLVTRSAGLLI